MAFAVVCAIRVDDTVAIDAGRAASGRAVGDLLSHANHWEVVANFLERQAERRGRLCGVERVVVVDRFERRSIALGYCIGVKVIVVEFDVGSRVHAIRNASEGLASV